MSELAGLAKTSDVKMGHLLLRSIPMSVRRDFKQACRARGTCMTHVLRRCMTDYIRSYKKEQYAASRATARK